MKKVLLKRSASLVQGQPVLPTTSEIEYGELAVNYASGHETISMKNSNNQVVSFSSDEKFLDKVGLGHDEENDELYVRGLGGFTGDNYTTATSLQEVISDNEFVTAAALNELNNNKLDASAATGFMTSAQVETQITGKNYVTSAQVETQITGKNYATVSQIPNVGDYFDGAEYDSENVRINFKHGDTVKAYIDAAAFIKDGMVSDVEIATPTAGTHSGVECLVVTFNTDAEKSVIEIPLSEIFDPSNYYNKTEVDSEIERLEGMIEDDEYVISTAINDLNARKLDSSAITDFLTVEGLQDMGFVTTDDLESMGNTTSGNLAEQAAQVGLAQSSALTELEQTVENNEYVTAVALNQLNADKLDASAATNFATTAQVETQITGKGYITGYTETDPTVPSWAKAANKPTYTASEVGAMTSGTTLDGIADGSTRKLSNYSLTSHTHSNYVTSAQVETQITGKGYITGYTETDPTVPSWAKQSSKPTYTASEVGAAAATHNHTAADLPTASTSAYGVTKLGTAAGTAAEGNHTHSQYLTGYTETDPTVPAWAKAANKPTYTASEVGALATGTTLDGIADGTTRKLSNYSLTSHTHSNYVTSAQVETQITGKNYATVSQVPSDSGLVHKTGNEVIGQYANKTFYDSCIFFSGATDDAGVILKEGGFIRKDSYSEGESASRPFQFIASLDSNDDYITLQDALDAKSDTGHTHSQYSLTGHTHTAYTTSAQVESQITGKNYVTSGQVETQVAGRVLPTVTAADNGKVLQVVNGAWALVTPSTVYTGENTPPSSIGNDGDIYLQTD